MDPWTDRPGVIARRGPLLAAILAAGAALPGIRLPFLADDWALLADVIDRPTLRTPFGYFRPLCMAAYWLDLHLWRFSPGLFHLTNVILISGVAALVVILIRRYVGDSHLAGMAGLLFALHPYHVENAAWIAGRADCLYSLLFLCAALAYDRWRTMARGLPLLAIGSFELALLAKETAVTLPPFIVLLGVIDARRRPSAKEVLRGYLPMAALALGHFLLVRPLALGGLELSVLGRSVYRWAKNLLAFGASTILPAQTEILERRAIVWGIVALAAAATLIVLARSSRMAIPPVALGAIVAFPILLGPSLISFQQRYLFLPSAASALALVSLLGAMRRRARIAALAVLLAGWCLSLGDQWLSWTEAGRVSRMLVSGLVTASFRPGVREIVVANMPHRVRGAPVAASFSRAVRLSGGRPVTVLTATAIDYPCADAETLDGPPGDAVRRSSTYAEIRLQIPDALFSRYVWPVRPPGARRLDSDSATVLFDENNALRVRVPTPAGEQRVAYFWFGGGLRDLF
jgi:hypothetical protein